MEFLVFPRALYIAPRDQYVLEVIVNNIRSIFVSNIQLKQHIFGPVFAVAIFCVSILLHH